MRYSPYATPTPAPNGGGSASASACGPPSNGPSAAAASADLGHASGIRLPPLETSPRGWTSAPGSSGGYREDARGGGGPSAEEHTPWSARSDPRREYDFARPGAYPSSNPHQHAPRHMLDKARGDCGPGRGPRPPAWPYSGMAPRIEGYQPPPLPQHEERMRHGFPSAGNTRESRYHDAGFADQKPGAGSHQGAGGAGQGPPPSSALKRQEPERDGSQGGGGPVPGKRKKTAAEPTPPPAPARGSRAPAVPKMHTEDTSPPSDDGSKDDEDELKDGGGHKAAKPKIRRNRIARACVNCRQKKTKVGGHRGFAGPDAGELMGRLRAIKCDGTTPRCGQCVAMNFECAYDFQKAAGPSVIVPTRCVLGSYRNPSPCLIVCRAASSPTLSSTSAS